MPDGAGDLIEAPRPNDAPTGAVRAARSVVASIVGVLGAACFVASLALAWQKTVIDPAQFIGGGGSGQPGYSTSWSLASPNIMGLAYLLGGMVLLAFVGAVAIAPNLASRLGPAAAGVTLGLITVLIGVTFYIENTLMLGDQGVAASLYGLGLSKSLRGITSTIQPGLYFAYGAVLLLMLAMALSIGGRKRGANAAGRSVQAPE